MSDRWTYRLYGHAVSLPFRCTQVAELPPETAPDIVVEEGPVPCSLESPSWEGDNWQVAPGLFLLRGGARAGRFLVQEGGRVTLERNPGGKDDVLAAHFLSHGIAALMRSLGLVVLHGSTLVAREQGVVLTGTSGAGKSTTQAALLARGAIMVSDDITVVRRGANGRVEALPGIPKLNLCEDAAEVLGRDVAALPRSPLRRIKVVAPHHGAMAVTPSLIHRLYRLEPVSGSEVCLVPLSGGKKFCVLQSCVYGPMLPDEHPGQFGLFTEMARQLQVFRLERPALAWSLDGVMESILHG